MIANDETLSGVLFSVSETMKSARRLKNAPILRNATDLRSVISNDTRWSGKYRMLEQFVKINAQLCDVAEDAYDDLIIEWNPDLLEKAQRFVWMLDEIEEVAKSLQTSGHTLAACRDDLQKLTNVVDSQRGRPGCRLYRCQLRSDYIAENASIVTCPAFERGVVKIQSAQENLLDRQEKRAVSCLLKSTGDETVHVNTEPDSSMPMAEQLRKRRKGDKSSRYMDCSFILGSVSEIERL